MTKRRADVPGKEDEAAKPSWGEQIGRMLPDKLTVNDPLVSRWAAAAVLFALLLYLIRWGPSTIRAVDFVMNPAARHTSTGLTTSQELLKTISLIGLALVTLHVLAAVTNTPRSRFGLAPSRRGLLCRALEFMVVFLVASGITWLGFLAAGLLELADPWAPPEIDTSPVASSVPTAVLQVIESGLGGAVEELVVLGVLVVALRAARAPWLAVYAIAVVLRVAFHVYYGVGFALGLGVWALGIVLLFHTMGRLWPIFVAHFVHNVIASGTKALGTFRSEGEAYWRSVGNDLLDLLAIAGLVVGALVVFAYCVKEDPTESPSNEGVAAPAGRE